VLGEFVTASHYQALLARGRAERDPLLAFDPALVRARYNRQPFLLSHRLGDDPRFALPALAELLRRLPADHVVCRPGRVPEGSDFDSSFGTATPIALDEALATLEQNQVYVYARNPESDPVYRPVIEGLIAEIAASLDPLDAPITWYSTYLFVSAQGSVTPYHMDREMNYLLQIRGTKTVQLWDPDDPDVMSDAEKDRLLSYEGARPPFRPELRSRAATYVLQPGTGVHHPFIAPHLVRTASELSISLAVTFRTRRSDIRTRAHQFNHHLRRLGIDPRPAGRSDWMDMGKAGLLAGAHLARGLRRPA
jgi:hypothetical protein